MTTVASDPKPGENSYKGSSVTLFKLIFLSDFCPLCFLMMKLKIFRYDNEKSCEVCNVGLLKDQQDMWRVPKRMKIQETIRDEAGKVVIYRCNEKGCQACSRVFAYRKEKMEGVWLMVFHSSEHNHSHDAKPRSKGALKNPKDFRDRIAQVLQDLDTQNPGIFLKPTFTQLLRFSQVDLFFFGCACKNEKKFGPVEERLFISCCSDLSSSR